MFPIHEIKFSRVLFEVTKCHTFFKKEMHLILLLNISPRMLFLTFTRMKHPVFFFIIMNESQALLAFKIFFFPESICPYWRKVHKAISRIKAILYCVYCHFLTRTSCLSDDIPVNLSTIIYLYSLSIDILILFFFVTLSLDVTKKHLQNL